MSNNNSDSPIQKSSPHIKASNGFVLHCAAIGELSNDKVRKCYTCSNRGYPNESIKIERISGRVLSDGTNETVGYKLLDYSTERPHQHKEPMKQQQVERYYKGWSLEAMLR